MQEKDPRMSGEKSREKQEQAGSMEAACEIFEILPDNTQYITLLDLYNELVDIYIGKGPYAYDKDSRLRHFREMFGKLPEDSKYKRPFFVLVYQKASQELNDPMKEEIFFEDTLSLIFQNRIGVAKVGQWMCGTCKKRSLSMLGESKEAAEAAAEIFEILPIYFQNDLNWMFYYELRDIYIGNKPREYDEDSRLRRFREMFRKLPKDSKYRRHFFVIGSDKDPYGLTPEETEICQFAMFKLQEMKQTPWERKSFAVRDARRDKISASSFNLASARGSSVASSPSCGSPKGERTEYVEAISFEPLGGSPKADEMIRTVELEEGMRERGPRMLGQKSSEKQEQARSVEAACEVFKNLPDDVKRIMIWHLYGELRDIYMFKLPYKHDEDSRLRWFKWMFEKLPEDSKYRRHFFVIGSKKEPQELTPEEDEIFGHILEQRNAVAKMGQKICAVCKKRSPGMLEVSKETQEQARSAEAAAEIFKNLHYAIQDALNWKLRDEIKVFCIGEEPDEYDEVSWLRRFREMFGKLPEDSKYRRHFFVLGSDRDPFDPELTPEESDVCFFALLKLRGHRQRERKSVELSHGHRNTVSTSSSIRVSRKGRFSVTSCVSPPKRVSIDAYETCGYEIGDYNIRHAKDRMGSIPSSSRLPMEGERNDYFKAKSFELCGGSSTQAGTSAGGVSNQ